MVNGLKIHDDHILQYTGPGRSGEIDIVIGLDFGTSASKVVVQVHGLPGNPAYAVNFGRLGHSSFPFLLPTRLWVSDDGYCTLAERANAHPVTDLKLRLFAGKEILNADSSALCHAFSDEAFAVAYLARLLRCARKWSLLQLREVIGHFAKINWGVNLGVPSPCIEENEENHRFRRVGKAAWLLSVLESEITLEKAEEKIRIVQDYPDDFARDEAVLACDFAIIPEIAAGAVGYASSLLRRDGLHLIIDVGASTIDVCSFVLHSPEGTDKYELLTADVKQLGTIRLHYERVTAISESLARHLRSLLDRHDPMNPPTTDREEYFLPNDSVPSALDEGEAILRDQCEKMIRAIVRDAWMRRDPKSSAWVSKLPVLLIGGGSRDRFFLRIVEGLDPWLRKCRHNNGIDLLDLTLPDTISVDKPEQDRLVVAWGLSHQEFNIGDVTAADKIPDVEPLPGIISSNSQFVSKDQV